MLFKTLILLLALLSGACGQPNGEPYVNQSDLSEITKKNHDLFIRTVVAKHDDDIRVTDLPEFQVCQTHEFKMVHHMRGRRVWKISKRYKYGGFSIKNAFFVEIMERTQDARTKFEDKLLEPWWFQQILGYEAEIRTIGKVVEEKFDQNIFYVSDTLENKLIFEDLLAGDFRVTSYTYDRSKQAIISDELCRDGERKYIRLISITAVDEQGNENKYQL